MDKLTNQKGINGIFFSFSKSSSVHTAAIYTWSDGVVGLALQGPSSSIGQHKVCKTLVIFRKFSSTFHEMLFIRRLPLADWVLDQASVYVKCFNLLHYSPGGKDIKLLFPWKQKSCSHICNCMLQTFAAMRKINTSITCQLLKKLTLAAPRGPQNKPVIIYPCLSWAWLRDKLRKPEITNPILFELSIQENFSLTINGCKSYSNLMWQSYSWTCQVASMTGMLPVNTAGAATYIKQMIAASCT